ncbi:methionine ABC transporter ATP-binding protein [Alkalihalophilus marmarensis]|jgi:D-methionine transport system ATP-binding protein|uniref:Methionine ABC transporter ATP-binding protein n=1 Tax=Alkalihalophilus marmarensis DSM 21297 TaxID=1188261 RepID=U6SLV0_9BACI|nr:methionine ABC transporter ATP-binding protein [Alkalihalophilus marmarensis]ERN52588.1 methionine ABC transporter ATP-binding protein [Alkalihalophilus marmarensis DSM 21297]MCM3490954.1 methionine ABC transporter ATP-binding protein [Alkalihalophilus marmarensis]
MIAVKNVIKEYKTKKGLIKGVDNVSLEVEKGEIFGIVGYSGAGKSSLLRCLNLMEKPTSGEIYVDGVNLVSLKASKLREARQKIGMIFQHFYLASSKTVFDNVFFALKAAGKSKAESEKKVLELLDLVGLSDKAQHYPSQLSGGQKQRVGIARALANDPKVLLCDEATSALDPSTTQSILKLLKSINEKLGLTIVLITHEMEVVKEICDRMAVMENGKVIELGSVYQLFAKPKEKLTKEFIDGVMQFKLPQTLMNTCLGTIIKIHFQGEVALESVVSDVLKGFDIKGNILHGKIEYIKEVPLGVFIMELIGDQEEIDKVISYLDEKAVGVEVITNDN